MRIRLQLSTNSGKRIAFGHRKMQAQATQRPRQVGQNAIRCAERGFGAHKEDVLRHGLQTLRLTIEWWHRRDQTSIQLETLSPVATHGLFVTGATLAHRRRVLKFSSLESDLLDTSCGESRNGLRASMAGRRRVGVSTGVAVRTGQRNGRKAIDVIFPKARLAGCRTGVESRAGAPMRIC